MARDVATPVSDEPEQSPKSGILSFFKELPVLIALALGIALVIKAFLVQAFFIPSASMEPTLRVGDRVLVNKLTYRFGEPDRGDVIVFRDPYGDPCATDGDVPRPPQCDRNVFEGAFDWFAELFGLPTGQTKDFIKRIIGLPGETIAMEDGRIFVCDSPCEPLSEDGTPQDGEEVTFPATDEEGPQPDNFSMPPYEIPEGKYYVLGDNRANSSDSRTFQGIDDEKIVGRAFVVVWPPTHFDGL